jgi:hypothetical protein
MEWRGLDLGFMHSTRALSAFAGMTVVPVELRHGAAVR